MVKKKRQYDTHNSEHSTDSSEEDKIAIQNGTTNICQHVKKAVDTSCIRKNLKINGLLVDCNQCLKSFHNSESRSLESNDFEYDNTLWLCLKCGTQLCGRTKNKHALLHYQTPHSDSHALTMNTRSFEVWCYVCDNEVSADSRKNLLECVELVKKFAQKSPVADEISSVCVPVQASAVAANDVAESVINKLDHKMTWKTISPIVPMTCGNSSKLKYETLTKNIPASSHTMAPDKLPRVRGLANLGNTCFFNAVMQCLAQTPFLLEVLQESSESGEEFILPGGTYKSDDKDIELPMIKGTLSSWGGLTAALANALEELQSGGGVFTPSKLFEKLCSKCPQFIGGDQHDSHELLRQLLESVRSEDLKRYRRVILESLGYKNQNYNTVPKDMLQKIKIYGNQVGDRILRPEQVFRGFLVSTLTCQECFSVSTRHENFLDISLPVTVEKPQPPQRRKPSPENSATGINTNFTCGDKNVSFSSQCYLHKGLNPGPTKAQIKKEKEKDRKAKRAAKHQRNKQSQRVALKVNGASSPNSLGSSGSTLSGFGGGDADGITTVTSNVCTENVIHEETPFAVRETIHEDTYSSSLSTSEHSDADIEDNLVEDNLADKCLSVEFYTDSNGNNKQLAEKRDDTPENMDKDSLEEDENDSGIATSPSYGTVSNSNNNNISSNKTNPKRDNSLLTLGLSEHGAILVRQLSQQDDIVETQKSATIDQSNGNEFSSSLCQQLDEVKLKDVEADSQRANKRTRTQSYSDWSTTIAPRYQCDDGECSVQSCLNNFTALELMMGNNQVGCENCTKNVNGENVNAKTVNTNATKQFLISSPPAVLILHFKRFQLGPRCIFRKLTRSVTFPLLLDIAPFCGSKVKNLPNIDRKQKKLLYALYGIVEHSGNMYGGHYTAYVKVRPKLMPDDKRWKFLPHGSKAELDQDDEQVKKLEELLAKEKAREIRSKVMDDSDDFTSSSTSSVSEEQSESATDKNINNIGMQEEAANIQMPQGKWYCVSDSRVVEVNEDVVLKSQAYLLFYERIY